MNAALGNAGSTVIYTDPIEAESRGSTRRRCGSWLREMSAGHVQTLLDFGRQSRLQRSRPI